MAATTQGKELDVNQQIDFLRKVAFFQGFDDHELKQFLQVSKWLRVSAKTLIIKENTTERAFYILVKGEVRVEKSSPGRSKPLLLTTLSSGDCFGEMALVTEIKRTADVVANRECFILRVEPDIVSTSNVFLQLKFYKRFCESLVSRLDSANKLVAGHEVRPADQSPDEQESPAVEDRSIRREPSEKAADKRRPQPPLPPMPYMDDRLAPNKLHPRIRPEGLLPINPAVAAELEAMLERGSEMENTRRFVDLILLDPILSCRVIQTANSPFYRRANTVGTVPHAMVLVGIRQMQKVVAGAITTAKPLRAFGGFTSVARDFWRHAVVVARIAEMLKEVIRVNVATDIYLSGLLHDLGMLALHGISPNFYPQLTRPAPELKDLSRAEKEYIGCDHALVGAWLGEGLGLPQPYLDVMRFHHQVEKATANQLPVALVSLADSFAGLKKACMGQSEITIDTILRSYAWGIIQEHHRPFLDVNVQQFVEAFSTELDKTWQTLAEDIPL